MIDNTSIENLKQRLDIVDVVGNYLELKRSGSSLLAVCPFHDDTKPSLHVSASKQIYHCFACGAGGDSIKFVMEHEKLSYPEAIERLASMYNFSLNYTQNDGKAEAQKRILETINTHYQKCLDANEVAKKYLEDRGIFSSSVEKFELGFAKTSFEVLNFLQNSGISVAEAQEFGIADIGQNGRAYARLSERITFPIYAQNGKLVGFGGRTISNHPAKYINSPQTKLFNKSRLLYGYDKAKQDIIKKKTIIVTEGYLDVIMLHQAGFTNAVATLGTALTKDHLPLLRRAEPKVVLSYDGDTAGINAAFKASQLLSLHGIEGGVVIFSDGVDPADMVKNGHTQELSNLFLHPKPFVEFCVEQTVRAYDIKNPMQKQKALDEASAYLKQLSPVVASSYQGLLASMLNVKESLVKVNTHKQYRQVQSKPKKFQDLQELGIVKTLLQTPSLIDTVLDIIKPDMLRNHFGEFELVLNKQKDSPVLREIMLLDDIKAYNEDELKNALLNVCIFYYQEQLGQVKSRGDLDFKKKSFLIKKIYNKIEKLKKGTLVEYESFSTI